MRHTVERPERIALEIPAAWERGEVVSSHRVTFGELGERVAGLSAGLRARGLKFGDRVALMFPVSVELYATTIALLASGMAVVLVGTGAGLPRVMKAIRAARVSAIIGMDALLRHRYWMPSLWGIRKFSIDSRGLFLKPFELLQGEPVRPLSVVPCRPDDHALITFTSGSTGAPKGVDRTHGLLLAQHRAQSGEFPEREDDVDMPSWPVMALHNLCCGITTVIPPIDLGAPATANGALVLKQINARGVTRISGSPAYMERLAEHMEASGDRAPTVRQLFVGGGPVPRPLIKRIRRLFHGAECRVLYGSSEAEPIATVLMDEILEADGEGFLVGYPSKAISMALIKLSDCAIELDGGGLESYLVAPGECGEVVVSGAHVCGRYFENAAADRENKIYDPAGMVWHRTGDVGYLDQEGRLWLTGRRKDIVRCRGRLVHPLPLEACMDSVQGVRRSALVALNYEPGGVVLIQLVPGAPEAGAVRRVKAFLEERGLADIDVRTVSIIPVDRRHNTKIDRGSLRNMAAAGK